MGALLMLEKCVYLIPTFFLYVYSNRYSEYFIESDKICTLGFRPRIIEIGKDAKSGAIVEELSYFSTLSGKYPYKCVFSVTASSGMGIFAVIQKMNLRKDSSGECIDYVQFRRTNSFQFVGIDITLGKDDKAWGSKHCGNVQPIEIDLSTVNPTDHTKTLPYAHIDRKGKMDVRIYIANESVIPGTDLDLKIAFTAFHVCELNLGSYKKCGADSCIWHEYFNDGILNCPFTNCADEGGCRLYYETAGIKPSAGLATRIMVAAVAGVFTMFIVFVMFLWLFRHCALCWNNSMSNAQNVTQMRPIPTIEDVQPTAPVQSPPDKDLPPSYESLFPDA